MAEFSHSTVVTELSSLGKNIRTNKLNTGLMSLGADIATHKLPTDLYNLDIRHGAPVTVIVHVPAPSIYFMAGFDDGADYSRVYWWSENTANLSPVSTTPPLVGGLAFVHIIEVLNEVS